MLKKSVILLLCLLLVIPATALAEEGDLPVLEKPVSLGVRAQDDRNITMILRMTQPDSIMKLYRDYYITAEIDWKINDGPWQTERDWEGVFLPDGLTGYAYEAFGDLEVYHAIAAMGHDDRNGVDIPMHYWSIGLDSPYDLQNNTYSFRFRYVFDYPAQDPVTGEYGYMVVSSPYSEVVTIGKGSAVPDKLDAPANLKVELKNREGTGAPYFYFTLDIPKSVEEVNKAVPVSTCVDWKIGDGKWATESGALPFAAAGAMLTDALEGDPVDEGGFGEVDIKKNTYYFRAYFLIELTDGTVVKSPYSNVTYIGTPAFYSGASTWAKPELQRAYDLGLIPDILIGADMTKPINREEFAELAILLYENLSGEKVQPASPNPFTDTTNPQILKAYKVGITAGTSSTTFSPKVLINREQCAAMLFRAIKALYPEADYDISDVKDFPDQKDISSWAVEAAKYMSKMGIIAGDSNGNFMPKATTSAQEAAGYGMATREQAIALSLRTFDKAPQIKSSGGGSSGTQTGGGSSGTITLESLVSKAKAIDTGYFEATSNVQGYITEEKYWKKGNMVKVVQAEQFDEKRTKVDIIDMSKGISYSYFVGQSQAVKGIYEVRDPSEYANPFNFTGPYTQGSPAPDIKITGNETVDGVNCYVITVTAEGTVLAKIWVGEDGLVRKKEMLYFGYQKTTVYKNYKIGGPINDSEFDLPAGMTINEDFVVTITE